MIAGSAAVSFWVTPLTFSFSIQHNLQFLELDESSFGYAVAYCWEDCLDAIMKRQEEEAEKVVEALTWKMFARENRLHHLILLHHYLVLR